MKRTKNFDHYSRENNINKKPKVELVANQEAIYNKIIELEKKINDIGFLVMNINNKLDLLIKQKDGAPEFYYYT